MKTDLSVQVVLQKCLHLYVDLSQYKNNELSFYFSRTTEIPGDSAWETILGNEESHQQEVKRLKWTYSLRNPPYGHLIITAPLFWPEENLRQSFSYLKNPSTTATLLTQPDFCGQLVTWLMGCYCTWHIQQLFQERALDMRCRDAEHQVGHNHLISNKCQ